MSIDARGGAGRAKVGGWADLLRETGRQTSAYQQRWTPARQEVKFDEDGIPVGDGNRFAQRESRGLTIRLLRRLRE